MYLKALEIQGFKSFPDKTVLNFGEDITAIVGPNGSGKSNISDAIRWVMGEQSSKSLRGVKMEDVIFGGTETRNQMGFAQVTLVLDNTEHIFPSMEETEVAVTRRYYRSGESEYYINKQSVRLRDVNELFMDTGMGREGYSIIGQGRIDEILSQKSGDRREIFEEAAGISRFRYRKEETERKLERTEENLVRINDKIAELELQVEPLRAQAETAKQYLIYRDELRLLEISVWLENLETLKTNAIKLDTDLSLAREELKKANADLEALYAASEQFSARIHENDIAQEEKRAQLSELDAQVKEQESAVAVLQTGIAHNEENIARVEEELRSQSDRVGSMDAQIAQQRARIEELERSKNEVETALSELLKQAEELSKNAGEAASEAETLRGREALALSAAADSRAEVAALRSTLSEMDERESAIAAEQESGEAQLSETRKSAAENRQRARKCAGGGRRHPQHHRRPHDEDAGQNRTREGDGRAARFPHDGDEQLRLPHPPARRDGKGVRGLQQGGAHGHAGVGAQGAARRARAGRQFDEGRQKIRRRDRDRARRGLAEHRRRA